MIRILLQLIPGQEQQYVLLQERFESFKAFMVETLVGER